MEKRSSNIWILIYSNFEIHDELCGSNCKLIKMNNNIFRAIYFFQRTKSVAVFFLGKNEFCSMSPQWMYSFYTNPCKSVFMCMIPREKCHCHGNKHMNLRTITAIATVNICWSRKQKRLVLKMFWANRLLLSTIAEIACIVWKAIG